METEELKWIEGYEGHYIITNTGRVFSMTRRDKLFRLQGGGEVILHKDGGGYPFAVLYKNGKGKQVKVHRLVAKHFISNPDNKPCIDHINGIKTDNRACNLRWCTHKENCNNPVTKEYRKSILDITKFSGEKNTFSRKVGQYNEKDELIAAFPSIGEACRSTGISHHSIQRCATGERKSGGGYIWKYLSEPKMKMPYGNRKSCWNKQPITQYDKQGNLIATYESIQAAADAVGCDTSNISRAARGITKSSGGYIWRYLDKENK